MKLSKLKVIFIGAFLSLVVLLFGSWLLRWHMDDYAIFSAIGFCFIGILLIVWHGIYQARLEKQRESQIKADTAKEKISLPKWIRSEEIITIFNVTYFQLKQHIFNGLPAYKTDIPVQFIDDKVQPMNEHDINFTLAYDDDRLKEDIKGLLFKQEDVLKFIKNPT